MTKQYKSVEQIVTNYFVEKIIRKDSIPREKPADEVILYDSSRMFYGIVASYFRIPTLLRKINHEQTIIQKLNSDKISNNEAGVTGLGFGAIAVMGLQLYAINEIVEKQNYAPAFVMLATNLLSGLYEFTRAKVNKKAEVNINSTN